MILTEGLTYKSLEQNHQPRNKPSQLRSVAFQQGRSDSSVEKGQCLQQIALGQLDDPMQNLSFTPLQKLVTQNESNFKI